MILREVERGGADWSDLAQGRDDGDHLCSQLRTFAFH
jgi:hypothetical protein